MSLLLPTPLLMSAVTLALHVGVVNPAAVQDDRIVVVLRKDAIPSIDAPLFEPASTSKGLDDHEPVIGLVGEREQRAYSTWQLDRHEIVNDTFEGRPIAATW